MKKQDSGISYSVLDFADGLEAYLFADKEIIPNLVDADGKPSKVDEKMRRILVAGRIITAYSPKGSPGESGATNTDEIYAITRALEIFENNIKCSVQELIEPLGAIVKIVKVGMLELLVNEINNI